MYMWYGGAGPGPTRHPGGFRVPTYLLLLGWPGEMMLVGNSMPALVISAIAVVGVCFETRGASSGYLPAAGVVGPEDAGGRQAGDQAPPYQGRRGGGGPLSRHLCGQMNEGSSERENSLLLLLLLLLRRRLGLRLRLRLLLYYCEHYY